MGQFSNCLVEMRKRIIKMNEIDGFCSPSMTVKIQISPAMFSAEQETFDPTDSNVLFPFFSFQENRHRYSTYIDNDDDERGNGNRPIDVSAANIQSMTVRAFQRAI